eukprot:CAMPEP_0117532474 /NCGR_PEP_ID=MMETSP0784-20121206/39388_1 /TAXON_ID=39447 /ORGANISM="" /LENGTH=1184 /DNA_ID=CAMNT_0005328871 /DNA_START=56 /DNA_END=3610 /DNA_ORIENTATION=+
MNDPVDNSSDCSSNSGSPKKTGQRGLSANVCELVKGMWTITRRFDSGLELECLGVESSEEARVHFPHTSLGALQHLRTSLQRQGAVQLGVVANDSKGLRSVFLRLVDGTSGTLSDEDRMEAKSSLTRRFESGNCRPRTPPGSDDYMPMSLGITNQSVRKETAGCAVFNCKPEAGREFVDLSVCALSRTTVAQPVIALARLTSPVIVPEHLAPGPLRYVVLVFCSVEKASLGSEVAEACAAAFMDEDFVGSVSRVPDGKPSHVMKAMDRYLSMLTIIPRIFLDGPDRDAGNCSFDSSENALEESLVGSIEKAMLHSRGVDGEVPVSVPQYAIPGAPMHARKFCVEVNEFSAPTAEWKVTHRLRQGLDLDIGARGGNGLHLPHASAIALSEARQLMTTASVALDVKVDNAGGAVDAVVGQLRGAGLQEEVLDEVSKALVDRTVVGPARLSSRQSDNLEINASMRDLVLKPEEQDEACHVLVMTSNKFKEKSHTIGRFLRFETPLNFALPPMRVCARFLLLLIGPTCKAMELSTLSNSLAAILIDDELMDQLSMVNTIEGFIGAVDTKLNHLTVVPHFRANTAPPKSDTDLDGNPLSTCIEHPSAREADQHSGDTRGGHGSAAPPISWRSIIRTMQKYSLPLVSGVALALVWSNADPKSYHTIVDGTIFGLEFVHPISLHFVVNDIFMCFFFGLAMKEVTEALLPGGSLSPLRRAVNPLLATLGGVAGPSIAYVLAICVLWSMGTFEGQQCAVPAASGEGGHRRLGGAQTVSGTGETEPCTLAVLLKGWGVPTATDISLAWMFALLIFGPGHPAINFLLLLAIVDDALGMVIIAVFYSDPQNPVDAKWLSLVFVGTIAASCLRFFKVSFWQLYILIGMPFTWLGLILAHVHPALALVPIVPLMPAARAQMKRSDTTRALGAWDLENPEASGKDDNPRRQFKRTAGAALFRRAATRAQLLLDRHHHREAPLHVFEHTMKLPVDLGMFFFGFANAGVALDSVGGVTFAVLFALVVGKIVGIVGFSLLAVKLGFALPANLCIADLITLSCLGGVGLTVALFVANEAFPDPMLQGQAKFAAVLSVGAGGLAWLIAAVFKKTASDDGGTNVVQPLDDANCQGENVESEMQQIEDMIVTELVHILWAQRRQQIRGADFVTSPQAAKENAIDSIVRGRSKDSGHSLRKSSNRNM